MRCMPHASSLRVGFGNRLLNSKSKVPLRDTPQWSGRVRFLTENVAANLPGEITHAWCLGKITHSLPGGSLPQTEFRSSVVGKLTHGHHFLSHITNFTYTNDADPTPSLEAQDLPVMLSSTGLGVACAKGLPPRGRVCA